MHELILGGQRSGKSRCAESRAAAWLDQPGRSAVLLATALPGDEEMRLRIAHHRQARAERCPRLETEEVPLRLVDALSHHSAPRRLVIIDCLTLWLTNLFMPLHGKPLDDTAWARSREALCEALVAARGPVLLVSNEIGLGVSPLSGPARAFVDRLGWLHQAVAARCARVTWMVAGLEMPVKREAA